MDSASHASTDIEDIVKKEIVSSEGDKDDHDVDVLEDVIDKPEKNDEQDSEILIKDKTSVKSKDDEEKTTKKTTTKKTVKKVTTHTCSIVGCPNLVPSGAKYMLKCFNLTGPRSLVPICNDHLVCIGYQGMSPDGTPPSVSNPACGAQSTHFTEGSPYCHSCYTRFLEAIIILVGPTMSSSLIIDVKKRLDTEPCSTVRKTKSRKTVAPKEDGDEKPKRVYKKKSTKDGEAEEKPAPKKKIVKDEDDEKPLPKKTTSSTTDKPKAKKAPAKKEAFVEQAKDEELVPKVVRKAVPADTESDNENPALAVSKTSNPTDQVVVEDPVKDVKEPEKVAEKKKAGAAAIVAKGSKKTPKEKVEDVKTDSETRHVPDPFDTPKPDEIVEPFEPVKEEKKPKKKSKKDSE